MSDTPLTSESLFYAHLKDEVLSAHQALDRLGIPVSKSIINRQGTGYQEITIGLAERIDLIPRFWRRIKQEEDKSYG